MRSPLRRVMGRGNDRMIALPDATADERASKRSMLFFRNFKRFQGGHLKVWDYYEHVQASGLYLPYISFVADSKWDDSNPWAHLTTVRERKLGLRPDAYFLAGRDWTHLDGSTRHHSPVPVINFVQHVRHADPDHDLYPYLAYPAIRICVDSAVQRAIEGTGMVRGPVYTIQNGTDVAISDMPPQDRDLDLVVLAVKNPGLGREIDDVLRADGMRTRLVDALIGRDELLASVSRSKATVFLPNPKEGAYLPPMEAMALGSLVICADHVGTSYCVDGSNAIRPAYERDAILEAVRRGLDMPSVRRRVFIDKGFATVRRLTLDAERAQFLDILGRIDETWRHVA